MVLSPIRRVARLAVLTTAVAIVGAVTYGCGGSNETGTAVLLIAAQSVITQDGTVGQVVAIPPSVVLLKNGLPNPGVTVTFVVATGGGSVVGATQVTDANGVARLGSWTLGPTAGSQSVNALASDSATGTPVVFTAIASPGPLAAIVKAAGDSDTSAVGAPITIGSRPTVRSTDVFGNAVGGATISFAVASGGGIATGLTQTTGVDGLATVGGWTLGTTAGTNTLTATAPGLGGSPLTFTATGVAGPVASLVKIAGDNQSAVIGFMVPVLPAVRAADQFGNVVAGQAVFFTVTSGGGTITGTPAFTDSTGVATLGSWALGPSPGVNTLNAQASALNVTFTATGTISPSSNAVPASGSTAARGPSTTLRSVAPTTSHPAETPRP